MKKKPAAAFSLVEVVLAVGIVAFVGLALLGLFSVGLNISRESSEELQATHVAQSLLAKRQAAPVAQISGLPLPPLDTATNRDKGNPVLLDDQGKPVSDPAAADFGMIYRIAPRPSGRSSDVYLCLFWPGRAPADQAQQKVEMFTVMPLP